jgi:predicted phosphoribosyltransferase
VEERFFTEPSYYGMVYVFRDRWEAGQRLGTWLRELGVSASVVYGIPAGGVPVAYAVAEALGSKLDVLVCRKVLIPWNREAGFGAVAPNGWYFVDWGLARYLGISRSGVEEAVKEQLAEVERRLKKYRCGEPYRDLGGGTVVVVDDGVAAGYTMTAAVKFLRDRGAGEVLVAVPTCHEDSALVLLERGASRVYCLNARGGPVYAVADAYIEWRDLEDEDVLGVLRAAKKKGLLAYRGECLEGGAAAN